MSLSFPTTLSNNGALDNTAEPKAAVKLTPAQQMHQLASSGHSVSQIATALGLPPSQVSASLGVKPPAQPPAPEPTVLPGRLSVKA